MPDSPTPLSIDRTLQLLRTIHGALLLMMFAYPLLAEAIRRESVVGTSGLPGMLAVFALSFCGVAIYFQQAYVTRSLQALESRPEDAGALVRWRMGAIVSATLCEAIVLCGFALRFLGGSRAQAAPFYAAGILLLIFWFPRRP